jgi:hypothetical protein
MVDPRILRRGADVARPFQRSEESYGPAGRLLHPHFVIPAKAGMHFAWFAHANSLT